MTRTLVTNARIFTADPANEWAEALVIDGETWAGVQVWTDRQRRITDVDVLLGSP